MNSISLWTQVLYIEFCFGFKEVYRSDTSWVRTDSSFSPLTLEILPTESCTMWRLTEKAKSLSFRYAVSYIECYIILNSTITPTDFNSWSPAGGKISHWSDATKAGPAAEEMSILDQSAIQTLLQRVLNYGVFHRVILPFSLIICEFGNTFIQKFIGTIGVVPGRRDICVTCSPRGST